MAKNGVWLEASIWANQQSCEIALSAFNECGAIGILVDDGQLPEGQNAYSDGRIMVKAYFDQEIGKEDHIDRTMSRFFAQCGLDCAPVDFSRQFEEDWQGNFVRSCTTFKVEPGIFIVSSFEIEQFKQTPLGDLFIEIDPENAFGTGQHQTTKLCLTALHGILHRESKNLAVLDVGTGSGILAILAQKLSAGSVLATETDEDALITARKNFVKNDVDVATLLVSENHQYEANTFHVIVANILAPVLIAMANNLMASLKPNGKLVLSGILKEQADGVVQAYQESGAILQETTFLDDWCCLVFR